MVLRGGARAIFPCMNVIALAFARSRLGNFDWRRSQEANRADFAPASSGANGIAIEDKCTVLVS